VKGIERTCIEDIIRSVGKRFQTCWNVRSLQARYWTSQIVTLSNRGKEEYSLKKRKQLDTKYLCDCTFHNCTLYASGHRNRLPYFSTYKALLFKAQTPPASHKPVAPFTCKKTVKIVSKKAFLADKSEVARSWKCPPVALFCAILKTSVVLAVKNLAVRVNKWPDSSSGRASASRSWGQRFESEPRHHGASLGATLWISPVWDNKGKIIIIILLLLLNEWWLSISCWFLGCVAHFLGMAVCLWDLRICRLWLCLWQSQCQIVERSLLLMRLTDQ
jgi:hypothetical protein